MYTFGRIKGAKSLVVNVIHAGLSERYYLLKCSRI